MSLPARADADPEYRYHLTTVYETPADWEAALEALRDRLDALEARAEQPLETPADLEALLSATEDVHRRKQRVQCYASLAADVATSDDDAADRQRRVRDLGEAFDPAVAAVHRRLAAVDADRFEALLAELDDHARYARSLREQAERAPAPSVESAVAALEPATEAPTRVIAAVTGEDLRTDPVERPDGSSVELTYGNRRRELTNPDRPYRRRVYEAFHEELERHEHGLATAFAEKLDAAAALADVRGYDSVRDRDLRGGYPDSGIELALPESVHDAMIAAVQETLDPYHRSLELRRRRLGVDRLRPWDLAVPITDADPQLSYDEARDLVVAATERLGEAYADRVERFLHDRRVDVYPGPDKRGDVLAKCPATAADGAFVFANFQGDVRSAFLLAHELGHAMNFEYLRGEPTRYATNSTAISEVPSLLHELVLAEELLDRGGVLAAAARDRLLSTVGGNYYGAGKGSVFTHRMVSVVEDGGEVTADRAREAYADLTRAFQAPVEYPEGAAGRWFPWARHGIYDSFQYVLGITGALVVRARLRDGSLSPADYREFLADTGREGPVDLFERLGCDVTSPDAYERSADAFDGYVDEVAG